MRTIALAALLAIGCSGSQSSPQTPSHSDMRARIVLVQDVAQMLDDACGPAAVAILKGGNQSLAEKIATDCDRGYAIVRTALVLAADALDTSDSASAGQIACAAGEALDGLRVLGEGLAAAGVKIPPVVSDALDAAYALVALGGGVCTVPATASDAADGAPDAGSEAR